MIIGLTVLSRGTRMLSDRARVWNLNQSRDCITWASGESLIMGHSHTVNSSI